ncbi:hypothetical protein Rsub_08356 [Raphidocelis subcapitata]|uniref:Right handed beta helix domain-containing protein n=1 Tax=Raphidocelis subcapitata TaxID=307507 RepID=A0A2V0P696_9CHLO|nr:hypothetical protein Rsub_08356 [Raphidocelis subcapitata]|eukprot:GBF95394.1 hypothetical protein Rsub_08356 [Raphidocelis subcapitata]
MRGSTRTRPACRPAAAAVAAVLLASLFAGASAQTVYRVSSCSELAAKFGDIAQQMSALTKGKVSITIELGCGQPGAYSDCPSKAMMPAWYVQGKALQLQLAIKGAAGCAGAARPVLSGAVAVEDAVEPLFMALEKNYHLTLQDLVLDGKEARPGIFADPAGSLTLVNVDVINCRFNYEEAPGLWARGTPVSVEGGEFRNNVAGGNGGAVYFSQIPGYSGGLSFKGTKFVDNKADAGGAIFVVKTNPKGAKVTCSGCVFDGNDAAYGSVVMTSRSDDKQSGEELKPGAAIKLTLSGSVVSGNANPTTAVCGEGTENLKHSKLVTSGTPLAPSSDPMCNDYALAQSG